MYLKSLKTDGSCLFPQREALWICLMKAHTRLDAGSETEMSGSETAVGAPLIP